MQQISIQMKYGADLYIENDNVKVGLVFPTVTMTERKFVFEFIFVETVSFYSIYQCGDTMRIT